MPKNGTKKNFLQGKMERPLGRTINMISQGKRKTFSRG